MGILASGSGLTNSAVAVKNSAGKIYGWFLDNTENTATTFFQFFNALSTAVTVGTTTPVMSLAVPGGASANVLNPVSDVLPFSGGISIAATTGFSNATAPANTVSYNIFGT